MTVFIELLLLLFLARSFGEVAERIGQPASVGEILAGIALAAAALVFGTQIPFLAQLAHSEVLDYVANAGIFCLVLLAGIELEPRELTERQAGSLAVAAGGVVLPLAGGFALAWAFLPDSGHKLVLCLLVGVALSISSIPATVKIFEEFGVLHTWYGRAVVSASIIDDVIGLVLLAIVLAMIQTGNAPGLADHFWLLARVAIFFGVTVALGAHVYPRVSRRLRAMQAASFEFSVLCGVGLGYGLLAEALGLHWILGAFMAGLYFERSRVGPLAYNEMRLVFGAVASGFLGPLFFASIGLRVELGAVIEIPLFLGLLIAVALFGKFCGAGVPAWLTGGDRRGAMAVGAGMSARGAVELVVISIAAEGGLFEAVNRDDPVTANLYSALILTGVVTTLLTPVMLRRILPRGPN
ncbi:MAG: cation:proton antiporter [Rhodospirillales bacterium]|nr:MAG: cation:proton antiporter [Rhodospirillales bacterium]